MLSLWDLITRQVPRAGLALLVAATVLKEGEEILRGGMMLLLIRTLSAVMLVCLCLFFYRRKQLGGADVWVMACLPYLLLPDQLTAALGRGLLHTGIISGLLYLGERMNLEWKGKYREKALFLQEKLPFLLSEDSRKLPLLPFIFWGCLTELL